MYVMTMLNPDEAHLLPICEVSAPTGRDEQFTHLADKLEAIGQLPAASASGLSATVSDADKPMGKKKVRSLLRTVFIAPMVDVLMGEAAPTGVATHGVTTRSAAVVTSASVDAARDGEASPPAKKASTTKATAVKAASKSGKRSPSSDEESAITCSAITAKGTKCKRTALDGTNPPVCSIHKH
jgi:hypothetical protein